MKGKTQSLKHYYWHVFLLCSLIFSQPLLETLRIQPEFLLAHKLSGLNLFYWIFTIAFVTELLFIAVVWVLTRLFKSHATTIKYISLFALFAVLVFIQTHRWTESNTLTAIAVSALSATVLTWLYARSVYLRTLLTAAIFLVVVSPAVFIMDPNVRQLLGPEQSISNTQTTGEVAEHPVVVILLDEMPMYSLLQTDGQINADRFPNFAAFSSQSTWYKYATTVAEATLVSVPPLLTGQIITAEDRKLPLAANYPNNLFTLLSPTHSVNAFETFTHLCPDDLCNTTGPDWKLITEDTLVVFSHIATPDEHKRFLPQIDNKWVGYLRGETETQNAHTDLHLHPHHRYKLRLQKLRQFIAKLETVDHKSLNYLHLMMPHSPWMYLPDGRVYSHAEQRSFTGTLPAGTSGLTHRTQLYPQQYLMDFVQQRYQLQLGFTDRLMGEVFSTLRKRKMFDDALIVVLADHGVSFKPGESLRDASTETFQDILSVPLFIKYPGQHQPATSLQAARTIDVLPTILESLNIEDPGLTFDGHSVLQPREKELEKLELQRDTGEIQEFQFAHFKHRFEQEVQARNRKLSEGSFDDIYTINGGTLINENVQDLTLGPTVDYSVRLDNPHLYDNVNLAFVSIPSLIRANRTTQTGIPGETQVAVAVNGIVRAVSVLQELETMPFDFQALVSPDSFKNGANSISFFEIRNDQNKQWLAPIHSSGGSQAKLINVTAKTSYLDLDSAKLPVSGSGNAGRVSIIPNTENGQLRLTGWSANSSFGQVADEVFIFIDGELITSVKPSLAAPQAQEYTGFESAEFSGFNLTIPVDSEVGQNVRSLSVIALFAQASESPQAAELRYINRASSIFRTRKINRNKDMLASEESRGVISLGRVYDFSDDEQARLLAGAGWSRAISGDARWNTSDEATLTFKAPGNEFSLQVIVHASPFFVAEKLESQAIVAAFLSGNEQLIELNRGETDGRFEIHVAAEDIAADGRVAITLKFLNATSPNSLNVNKDDRLLAMRLKTIQILAAQQNRP